jgi:parallel beta-helix repeat protein
MKLISLWSLSLLIFLNACSKSSNDQSKLDLATLKKANAEAVDQLVAQFIEAEEGGTINIPEGFYELQTQLVLDNVNNVTIKGAGMYKTVISFKNQSTGGEGMKISGNKVTLEDFTVLDAPGDDIKTQKCDGLTFRRINTSWTATDLAKSGTYGIYPVQCKNVLIEDCEVSNSRDAGIYVGQSENIIVRNNYVHQNVAGIEIENSDNAEVYNNRAIDNTSGILVFNLPGLPKAFGINTKVYKNHIEDNNHDNFAQGETSENGNPITMIPPGSGVIILAGKNVEVFENKIINHKTTGVAILNYQITQLKVPNHPGWSPYSSDIYFHDNYYERKMGIPDMTKEFGQLIAAKCRKPQDFIYDGIIDENKGKDIKENPMNICIDEKSADFRFSRFIIPDKGGIMDIKVESDIENFKKCNIVVNTNVSSVGK